ncbi:hypothetical protein SAMN06269301_1546 [Geobacter sp. DSM 9736]|nr:hypothetical protein SAMN06269301_1546 [Geobacter sp. DSM 9736]
MSWLCGFAREAVWEMHEGNVVARGSFPLATDDAKEVQPVSDEEGPFFTFGVAVLIAGLRV